MIMLNFLLGLLDGLFGGPKSKVGRWSTQIVTQGEDAVFNDMLSYTRKASATELKAVAESFAYWIGLMQKDGHFDRVAHFTKLQSYYTEAQKRAGKK